MSFPEITGTSSNTQPDIVYNPYTGRRLDEYYNTHRHPDYWRGGRVWEFDPWTGQKRCTGDIEKDPLGVNIWYTWWGGKIEPTPPAPVETTPEADTLAASPSSRQVGGSHYLDMPIEPWDIIGTWSIEQQIGFFKGNALKYLLRAGSKGDVITDLDKCVHYIERLKQTIRELKESPR